MRKTEIFKMIKIKMISAVLYYSKIRKRRENNHIFFLFVFLFKTSEKQKGKETTKRKKRNKFCQNNSKPFLIK